MEEAAGLETEIAQAARSGRQRRIAGQHHAAFARGDQLVGEKAKGGKRAKAAATLPFITAAASRTVFTAMRLRGVLDDVEAMPFRQIPDRIHVDRMAVHV